MFPRSLAFSTAFAAFASSLLQPMASAEVQASVGTTATLATAALPEARPEPEPEPEPEPVAKTAWQARIEGRLATLPVATVVEPSNHPSPALIATLERLATSMEGEAAVGIAVKDLRTGEIVFEHHGERPLNPASNRKLLTATAAVTLLGEDYRFETTVLREGNTLILRCGGDPSLQVDDLEALAASVDAEGVERIIVDGSMFSARTFGPGYDPGGPGFSYMAPSGALSLQYNTVVVHVGREGVRLDPPCEHLEVEYGRPHGPVDVTTMARDGKTIVRVDGRPRGSVKIRRRVADPARFAASVFARALGRPALPIEAGVAPSTAQVLARHQSAPLPDVLGSALKFSNNFTTEQVLRTLGHHASGAPGDWENGARVLRAFWEATGQDPGALTFENASGLSGRGRVTPPRDGRAGQPVGQRRARRGGDGRPPRRGS